MRIRRKNTADYIKSFYVVPEEAKSGDVVRLPNEDGNLLRGSVGTVLGKALRVKTKDGFRIEIVPVKREDGLSVFCCPWSGALVVMGNDEQELREYVARHDFKTFRAYQRKAALKVFKASNDNWNYDLPPIRNMNELYAQGKLGWQEDHDTLSNQTKLDRDDDYDPFKDE